MKTAHVHTWILRASAVVLALSMGAGECVAEGRAGPSMVIAAVTSAMDLTGRWDGAWESTRYSVNGLLTTQLVQSGAALTGDVTILGSGCTAGGTVSGTVSGATVIFGAVAAGDEEQTNFVGTMSGDGKTMSGTYEVTSGPCGRDIGLWSVIKVSLLCDVNNDSAIDRQDAIDLAQFLLAGVGLPSEADCNQDGQVNWRDVLAILKSRQQ
jgi:hypothetical protein